MKFYVLQFPVSQCKQLQLDIFEAKKNLLHPDCDISNRKEIWRMLFKDDIHIRLEITL